MKAHLENKITSVLENKALKVTSIRGIMGVEKNRHKAEIIVNIKNHSFEADAETYDMYESIDVAVEKIDAQLRKHLDRIQDHRYKEDLKSVDAQTEEAEEKMEYEVE